MEKVTDYSCTTFRGKIKIFLNGEWVGICEDSLSFVDSLRKKRRQKELPSQVEIKRDAHQGRVRIFSDSGRILRPLVVVNNLKRIKALKGDQYNFSTLLGKGIVELIGAEEEEECYLPKTREGRRVLHRMECQEPLKGI